MKKKRKVWRWVLLGVLVLVIVVVILISSQSRNASARYAEETVTRGTIETYFSFSGNVDVRNSQAINAKTNATIRELYVAQDDMVAAGAPLLRLSTGDIVKADISGEVTEVHVAEGDSVSMGAPLVDIVDFEDLQVLIKVDEFDVGAVSVGKTAAVTIDALGLTYEATVEHIGKQVQSTAQGISSSTDVNYYEAKLTAPADARVLPGMKVDVKVLNERQEDALLLPMTALQFDAYNKPYVYTRDEAGELTVTEIGVGIQDGTTVQITDGLREGEVALVPQSQTMFMMMQQMRQ